MQDDEMMIWVQFYKNKIKHFIKRKKHRIQPQMTFTTLRSKLFLVLAEVFRKVSELRKWSRIIVRLSFCGTRARQTSFLLERARWGLSTGKEPASLQSVVEWVRLRCVPTPQGSEKKRPRRLRQAS